VWSGVARRLDQLSSVVEPVRPAQSTDSRAASLHPARQSTARAPASARRCSDTSAHHEQVATVMAAQGRIAHRHPKGISIPNTRFGVPISPHPKPHFDRFSRFCAPWPCVQHTDRQPADTQKQTTPRSLW